MTTQHGRDQEQLRRLVRHLGILARAAVREEKRKDELSELNRDFFLNTLRWSVGFLFGVAIARAYFLV